jgi:hypothetical protein
MESTTTTNARLCICAGNSTSQSNIDFSYAGHVTTGNPGTGAGAGSQARIALLHTNGLLAFFTKQYAAGNTIPAMTIDGSTANQTILINSNSTSNVTTPYRLYVTGNTYLNGGLSMPQNATGTISCYTVNTVVSKAFDIVHPTREGMRLRHRCVESDRSRLFYEYTMECQLGLNSLQLPDWFTAINADCRVYCSPVRHFGAAWGEVVSDQLQVTCNAPGTFWVYVTGVRCDAPVIEEWERLGVEYPDPAYSK